MMKIKLKLFTLLFALFAFSCAESTDERPLEITNSESGLNVRPCLLDNSCAPPHFNLSLAFEQYLTAGDGTETGHISAGIDQTLSKDLTIYLKFEGRISSSSPYQTLIPVYPTLTISAGTTLSQTEALLTEMIDPCQTEIDIRLSVDNVKYGTDFLSSSDYTMISGPYSSQTLNTPNASCSSESITWIKGDVIVPGDDFDYLGQGG